jgi:hypothetical protein
MADVGCYFLVTLKCGGAHIPKLNGFASMLPVHTSVDKPNN